jgi:hypothetical protein
MFNGFLPRVARSSQPWALWRNPVGIRETGEASGEIIQVGEVLVASSGALVALEIGQRDEPNGNTIQVFRGAEAAPGGFVKTRTRGPGGPLLRESSLQTLRGLLAANLALGVASLQNGTGAGSQSQGVYLWPSRAPRTS